MTPWLARRARADTDRQRRLAQEDLLRQSRRLREDLDAAVERLGVFVEDLRHESGLTHPHQPRGDHRDRQQSC